MEWFKIETEVAFFSPLTINEKGILMSILGLTAYLERQPTIKEILRLEGVTKKKLKNLIKSLKSFDKSLAKFSQSVAKDSHKILKMRIESSRRKQKSRSNVGNNLPNVTCDNRVTSHQCHAHREDIDKSKNKKEKNLITKKEKVLPITVNEYSHPDPSNHEQAKPYYERVFKSIHDNWPKNRRGSFLSDRAIFFKNVDTHSNDSLFLFMSSTFEYLGGYEKWNGNADFCKSLKNFFSEWEFFIDGSAKKPDKEFHVLVDSFCTELNELGEEIQEETKYV